MQPYNEETGKYEDIDVLLPNNEKVRNYDEFLKSRLPEAAFSAYQKNPVVKSQVDERIAPIWQKLLSHAVDRENAKLKRNSRVFFATAEEAMKNAHQTITKEFVDDLVSSGFPSKETIVAYDSSKVELDSITVFYMKHRYARSKFNPINEEEYQRRLKEAYSISYDYWALDSADDLVSAWKSGKDIPVYRGVKDAGKNINDRNRIVSGMVSDNDAKTITNIGSPKWYGSCIYMSTCRSYASSYSYGGFLVHGLIRGGAVSHPLDYHFYEDMSPRYLKEIQLENEDVKKISDFVNGIDGNNEFRNAIYDRFHECGMNDEGASRAADLFIENIKEDIGFCAAVLGYDSIIGRSGQFDILDPSVVDLSVQWE